MGTLLEVLLVLFDCFSLVLALFPIFFFFLFSFLFLIAAGLSIDFKTIFGS